MYYSIDGRYERAPILERQIVTSWSRLPLGSLLWASRRDKGDTVRNVNPQGAILTKHFRLPDSEADTAATWQQFAMSIVVDLLIMACFIAYEVMSWDTRKPKREAARGVKESPTPEVLPQISLPPAVKPRLVATLTLTFLTRAAPAWIIGVRQ
jgi:hypothetical protein